jgi:hypothetical protein
MKSIMLCLLFLAASVAHAETYYVDHDLTMPVNCTNPTAREDGTPLLLSEIDRIEFFIFKGFEQHVVTMQEGCALVNFDLSVLTPGRWGKQALTHDTGGRLGKVVEGLPFEYAVFIANPNGPTIIEPGE